MNSIIELAIRSAIVNDEKETKRYIEQLDDFLIGFTEFPADLFAGMIHYLGDERIIQSKCSSSLMWIFESNWNLLSENQKLKLIELFGGIYESYLDWMSCFMINEFLGLERRLGSVDSFHLLIELKNKTKKEMPRSLLPHGFECLYPMFVTKNREIAEKCISSLEEMKTETVESVRMEATESLARLVRRGLLGTGGKLTG